MSCPSCGAPIGDEEAVFCPRCGVSLGGAEGETTARLSAEETAGEARSPAPGDETREDAPASRRGRAGAGDRRPPNAAADNSVDAQAQPPRRPGVPAPGASERTDPGTATRAAPAASPRGDTDKIESAPPETVLPTGNPGESMGALARDLAASLRSYLVAGGWVRATEGGAIAFLALLAVGSVFVLLAKLLDAGFGAGENPVWMLTRIVLAALWSVGVPIERADAGGAALPLGVLSAIAWVLSSTARRITERSTATSLTERAVEGAKVGVPFALLCFLAAIVFRIRSEGADVGADPGAALVVPLVWGAMFGALGGLLSAAGPRDLVRDAGKRLERLRSGVREGIWAGVVMLAATFLMSLAVVLVFLVGTTVAARSVPLTLAEAAVFLVALAAFLPNAVAGAAALSLGAPLEFLARTIDGAEVERRASLIVGGHGARGYAYLLLAIPATACLLGGYVARRRTQDARRAPVVLGAAAATFAIVLWFLVLLSGVRVSQAFIGAGNYLVVAANSGVVLLLAVPWAGAFGYAGWRLAEQGKAA